MNNIIYMYIFLIFIILLLIKNTEHFVESEKDNIDYKIEDLLSSGDTGDTGKKGLEGPRGVSGMIGIPGPKGPKGAKGNTGIRGPAKFKSNCNTFYTKCVNYITNTSDPGNLAKIFKDKGIVECPYSHYQNGYGLENCGNKGMRVKLNCCRIGRIDHSKNSNYGDRGPRGPRGFRGFTGKVIKQPKFSERCYEPKKAIFSGNYVLRNYTVNPIRHVGDDSIIIYAIHNHVYTKMVGFRIINDRVERIDGRAKRGYFPLNPESITATWESALPKYRNINSSNYNIRFLKGNEYIPKKAIFSGSWVGRNYTVNPIRHTKDYSLIIYAIHNHIYTKMVGFKIVNNKVKRIDGRAKRGYFPLKPDSVTATWNSSPSNLRNINNSQYNIRFL